MSNAVASIVTVPTLPEGWFCYVQKENLGDVTFAIGSGLSFLNPTDGKSADISKRHGVVKVYMSRTNSRTLTGDLTDPGAGGVDVDLDYTWTGLHTFEDDIITSAIAQNTRIGVDALALASGADNTAFGYQAGDTLTTATGTTAIGSMALGGLSGNNCTAIGALALGVCTGQANTAIGYNAGGELSTGVDNVMIGTNAGQRSSVGDDCVFIGKNAGRECDANSNTLIGNAAGEDITTGTNNVAIGSTSLRSNISGANNMAIGTASLVNCTGGDNTVVGASSGDVITTGSQNTMLGFNCEVSTGAASNQISMGWGVTCVQNYQFSFGNGGGGNTVRNEFNVDALWTRSSDVRKKTNIEDSEFGLELISQLRPVEYNWKEGFGDTEIKMSGLIAQEVEAALDGKAFRGHEVGEDGYQTLRLEAFIMPLINAVKELEARVKELEGDK